MRKALLLPFDREPGGLSFKATALTAAIRKIDFGVFFSYDGSFFTRDRKRELFCMIYIPVKERDLGKGQVVSLSNLGQIYVLVGAQ